MYKQPNVILVNCDDLGYGDLGCYGSTRNDTPALFSEGDFVILITNDYDEDENTLECIEFLNKRQRNFKLNKIILTNQNIISRNQDDVDNVIFNIESNKILFCQKGLETLAQIALMVNDTAKQRKSVDFIKLPITFVLIALNIIMYIISAILSKSLWNIDIYTSIILGAKYGPLIDSGEWWRLITCMFLHGGFLHIIFNMYSLYIVGSQIEPVFSKAKYIILYFITGLASSMLSYLMLPNTVSVGASGAIFGLLGTLLVLVIKNRDKMSKNAITNLVTVIGLNLFIGATNPGIDNYAHIGGLGMGIILGIVYLIKIKENKE